MGDRDDIAELLNGSVPTVSFVTPLFAVCSAALSLDRPRLADIHLGANARQYAGTTGLLDALSGQRPSASVRQGRSYSSLARLDDHLQVEAAGEIIIDFVQDQLQAHPQLAQHIGRVVGELHDNVASHSGASGFSAAQKYAANSELVIAIADCGCGMLHNVRRKLRQPIDDFDAIRWCLQRGNTTGAVEDEYAQRLADDAPSNPYPSVVKTSSKENHHLGEGLWQLSELVRVTGGRLMVWSGAARIEIGRGSNREDLAPHWRGVAIEFVLPMTGQGGPTLASSEELEALASRLGI